MKPSLGVRYHHEDIRHGATMLKTLDGLLQHGLAYIEDIQKLLGLLCGAYGPKTASYAPGHDDEVVVVHE